MAYNYDNEIAALSAQNSEWATYYSRLRNLACTMFKWKNLPDSVNERFLEETLFLRGFAVFFNSETMGYLGLECALEGMNVYRDPLYIRPVANSYTFDAIPADNCVLIRNTPDMFPTVITTLQYAKSLYDIDLTIDINVKAQKTPVLILTDQKQRQTVQAVYQKYTGNTPVIYGQKETFDPNSFRVLNTGAPFVASSLQDIKITKYNEYLSFLGIGMADEKRERRITGEVEPFKQQANALANIGLSQRKEACKQINKLFGLNVDVELSADPYTIDVPKMGTSTSTVSYVTAKEMGDDK